LMAIPPNIRLDELANPGLPVKNFIICADVGDIERCSSAYIGDLGLNTRNLEEPRAATELLKESGYRILTLARDKTESVVFLNASELDSQEVRFLVEFLPGYLSEIENSLLLETRNLMETILSSEDRFQRQYGFPKALFSDEWLIGCRRAESGMMHSWAEHCALRNAIKGMDASSITKYVDRKLHLFEEILAGLADRIRLDETIYELFIQYLKVAAICMALPRDTQWSRAAFNRVANVTSRLKTLAELKKVPSLSAAVSIFVRDLFQPDVFENREAYETSIPKILDAGTERLAPEFFHLTWCLELRTRGLVICQGLSTAPDSIPEPVVNDFIELCERIAEMRGVHELPALVASQMRMLVLISLGYFIGDRVICRRIEQSATDNLSKFERRIDLLKEPFPELEINEGDLLLCVWSASSLCISLGDFEAAERLRGLIDARKGQPEAKTVMAQVMWTEFLAYEDYDRLIEFRTILPQIRKTHEPLNELLEPEFDALEMIADAILHENGRLERLARAELLLTGLSSPSESLGRNATQFFYMACIVDGLRYLYHAAQSETVTVLASDLSNAVEIYGLFGVLEHQDSPNYLLYLKTNLLDRMALGEIEETSRIAQAILGHKFVSSQSEVLANLALAWVDVKTKRADPVLAAIDVGKYSDSPWVQIARHLISVDAKRFYIGLSKDSQERTREAHFKGMASFWKGTLLEVALQAYFATRGYVTTTRMRIAGREQIDLLCHKLTSNSCEVILVDAKATGDAYGPAEARDFAVRVRRIRKQIRTVIQIPDGVDVDIVAIVASSAQMSAAAENELLEELKGVPLRSYVGKALKDFLESGGVKIPSSMFEGNHTPQEAR
jgi:hypothetical protein